MLFITIPNILQYPFCRYHCLKTAFASANTLYIAIGALIFGIIIVNGVLKRRRGGKTPQETVALLLYEIYINQKLSDTFHYSWRVRKFKTNTWKRARNRLSFLNQRLLDDLSNAFTMADDFNQQINLARRDKSSSYVASINVDKLKPLLARSREGLEEWMHRTTGKKGDRPSLGF